MKKRKSPLFSKDDQMLWKRVADTTTPLTPQRGQFLKEQMDRLLDESAPSGKPVQNSNANIFKRTASPQPPVAKNKLGPLISHPIDKPILKKLSRGRVSVDSRIDLHGMTQDRARFALLDFLQMAQRSNYRIVLIITGKGNDGMGVLRQNVPQWLKQSQFAVLVNGVQTSHSSHGGEGALYVRIRKSTKRRP